MTNKLAVSALVILCLGTSYAQNPQTKDPNVEVPKPAVQAGKRAPTTEDFKQWERLLGAKISNNGRYLTWGIAKVDGDGLLMARKIDGPEKWSVPNGSQPEFSDTSNWLGYIIGAPKAEAEQSRPSSTKLGIRNMDTGEETIVEDVVKFEFLKNSNLILATRPKATPGPGGNDLLIINPAGGEHSVVSNVAFYATNETENLLAIKISSGAGYSALQLLNPFTMTTRTLYSGKDDVSTFDWAKEADVLIAAIAKPNEKKRFNNYKLLRFSALDQEKVTKDELDPEKWEGFPQKCRINEMSGLFLSKDGSSVLFGIQAWLDRSKPVNPKDVPGVQIWNTKDTRPIPQQVKSAGEDRAQGAMYTWNVSKNKLTNVNGVRDGDVPGFEVSTSVAPDHQTAVIVDGKPYLSAVTNGVEFKDIWVVDLENGDRNLAVKKNSSPFSISPSGKFIAYYENKVWWTYDVVAKKAFALRPDTKVTFEDPTDDHTVDVLRPAGFPIWFESDAGLMINDQYDAWWANPRTGKMFRLTEGRSEKIRFEFQNTTPYEELPKVGDRYHFSMFDTVDKKMGYFISDSKGGGKPVSFDDASFSRLTKAKNADRMMYVFESFQKSPDVYITNEEMTAAKPVTRTNPQQNSFHWGKTELVQFKSRWGLPLQGTLTYPANFDPKKKYPMVTYIYERLSDEQNDYQVPLEWNAYDVQHLSHSGYFVFKPDMAYKPNQPGESSVDCLEPAVDAALKLQPAIDAKKVGLIGHSWGAYQTAYATTVSDRFAVGACGAPLTELTSMYNSFYWNVGISSQILFETYQGRIKSPFWENAKAYIDNSPVWKSSKRKAPLLMAVGDNDGAVDWTQGQYLFNTLRRMGKECVLLVYAGENHNFRVRANQLDYAKRLRHWLDVHLKGEKADTWVKEGVPYIKQTDK